jgi:ketose-bisphosphate aldolase
VPVVSARELLEAARRRGYAVGAFSVHTPEMVEGVFRAAERLRAPVILQVGQRVIRQAGLRAASAWVLDRGRRSEVPACLHLDHSRDLRQVVEALEAGCTSVMFDGSHLPFAENVAATREVVELCHRRGVPVEGELGRIAGVEDRLQVAAGEAALTDPEEAARFVEATGVDALAPAVGSVHGLPPAGTAVAPPSLDLDRLAAIAARVAIPLVLHGGSGLLPETLREAIRRGIAKVNVDTELRRTFGEALRAALAPGADDPWGALDRATEALALVVGDKIAAFGSAGAA